MADYTSTYTGAEIDANLALAETALQAADMATTVSLAASAVQPDYTGDLAITGNETIAGDLTFSGTARRILGDFSNSTVANRPCFQSSTTNGNTQLCALPNGTGSISSVNLFNASDPTNTAAGVLSISPTSVTLQSRVFGSGTLVPLFFRMATTDRGALDTNGNFLFGATTTTDTVTKVQVTGAIKSSVYTVATLPVGTAGCRSFVSDANATHAAGIGNAVVAGGANFVPVYHNGTSWLIG